MGASSAGTGTALASESTVSSPPEAGTSYLSVVQCPACFRRFTATAPPTGLVAPQNSPAAPLRLATPPPLPVQVSLRGVSTKFFVFSLNFEKFDVCRSFLLVVGPTRARPWSQRHRSAMTRLLELAAPTATRRSALYRPAEQVSVNRVAELVQEQKTRFCRLRRHHRDVKNHGKYPGPRPAYHSAGGTPRGLRRQPEAAWGIPQIPQRDIFLSAFHVASLMPQSDLSLLKMPISAIENVPAAPPRAIYLSVRPPRLLTAKMGAPRALNPKLRN